MNLFNSIAQAITGQQQIEPIEEKEARVDYQADGFQDKTLLAQEMISQNEVEFREKIISPSRLDDSTYHDSLIKEIPLSILSPADEDYFGLSIQVMNVFLSLGLIDTYKQLHAQMEGELLVTRARKGKQLEYSSTFGHIVTKNISETKNKGGW